MSVAGAARCAGYHEIYPLSEPGWSLFFDYVDNVLYATVVLRFTNVALGILVVLSAGALLRPAVTSPEGNVIGGWSLKPRQLHIGFTRIMCPFFAELLSRLARLRSVPNAFEWCSIFVVGCWPCPVSAAPVHLRQNGLYDALSIILVFPGIFFLGAVGAGRSAPAQRLCRFLGDISYPIHITHYPLIYT